MFGRALNIELEHPTLVMGEGCKNTIARDADWMGDYDITAMLCMRVKNKAGIANQYITTVFVCRDPFPFTMNVMLPVFTTLLLSMTAYWVDPCNLADRLSVTLTLLLTQAAFMVVVKDQLPSVPYLTPIEKVIVLSLSMLFMQAVFFTRVRMKCLRQYEDQWFNFGLDPAEVTHAELNEEEWEDKYPGEDYEDGVDYAELRAADGYYYTKKLGAYYDALGVIITAAVSIISMGYIVTTWLYSRSYRKRFRQEQKDRRDTPDLNSMDEYHKYMQKTSHIKTHSEAFSSEEAHDTEHEETAFKFHEQVAENNATATDRAVLIFDCGTGATKGILCMSDSEGVRVVEPDDMEFKDKVKFPKGMGLCQLKDLADTDLLVVGCRFARLSRTVSDLTLRSAVSGCRMI